MKNILVTGANGQLGQAIRQLVAEDSSFHFIFTDVDTLDICNKSAVLSFLQMHFIHAIINVAAYTAVDRAEAEEETAYRINCEAVRNLAEAAKETGCKLIHISTDYVFDGTQYRPYIETDITCPVSAYGRSKLAGENVLQETSIEAIIIRTSWLYSAFGANFLKTMLRLGKEREEIGVIFDQVGTPTYAGDLAKALFVILEKGREGIFHPGIYHFSNEGVCSWYDFSSKIMEIAGLSCRVKPIETKEYPTPAQRPFYSVLNKAKIKETYGLLIPHWEESLKSCIHTFEV